MLSPLSGKVAIITGASSGIGRAMSQALAELGCKVVLAARSAEKLNDLALEIGPDALAISTDLTSDADIKAMIEKTIAHFGGVDILYECAGVFATGPFAEADPDHISQILDVNVRGVMLAAHAVLPHMRKRGTGDILVVGSIAGVSELRDEATYSASKYAVQTFVRILRRQVAADGVRVGIICPGTVATELWGVVDPEEVKRRVAAHEVLTPEDVASASILMLSQPAHVTIRDLVILPQAQDI